MVTATAHGQTTTITLAPNRSIEWQQVKLWLLLLSLPALIIALGWFALGVWIILPFAGLEIGLLCYFMYKVCYNNYSKQTITVAPQTVTVESGVHATRVRQEFLRPDCYLMVTQPEKPIDNLQLQLTNSGSSLAVGEFLNPADRELARRSLISAGLIECSSHWWQRR